MNKMGTMSLHNAASGSMPTPAKAQQKIQSEHQREHEHHEERQVAEEQENQEVLQVEVDARDVIFPMETWPCARRGAPRARLLARRPASAEVAHSRHRHQRQHRQQHRHHHEEATARRNKEGA